MKRHPPFVAAVLLVVFVGMGLAAGTHAVADALFPYESPAPTVAMPPVASDECAIVSVDILVGEPTFIDPNPDATSMRLIVYCGQRNISSGGTVTNEQELKFIDVDLEQAEIIVQAAADLLGDGDVHLP